MSTISIYQLENKVKIVLQKERSTPDNFFYETENQKTRNLRCSLANTRRRIEGIILSNPWQYFLTQTLKDINGLPPTFEQSKELISKMLLDTKRKAKKLGYDFTYLATMEYGANDKRHKSTAPKRWHAHIFINNLPVEWIDFYNKEMSNLPPDAYRCMAYNLPCGRFNLFKDNLGTSFIEEIWNISDLAVYPNKNLYLDKAKDFPKGKSKYIRSRGLKEPKKLFVTAINDNDIDRLLKDAISTKESPSYIVALFEDTPDIVNNLNKIYRYN